MKILLLGLGRANIAVARYLHGRGDEIALYEEHRERLSPEAQSLIADQGITEDTGGAGAYQLAIASPGFPDHAPVLGRIRERRIPVIDEIEFTYRELGSPSVIAVTGTNGKSTTASLISQMLDQAGVRNFLGGNLAPGRPFSQALFEARYDQYVLEVSSFQLTRTESFRPRVALLTNIRVDHLNWHLDLAEYAAAKARIFFRQEANDTAVLNYEDDAVRKLAAGLRAQILWFGHGVHDGAWVDGDIHFRADRVTPAHDLPLLGDHNVMNILAAVAATAAVGIPIAAIERGIRGFRPLPHRLEDLGVHAGIRYINNSMCTNEDAAIKSFRALSGSKVIIAGGRGKGDAGRAYLDLLVREAKACVLLGDNAGDIAAYFQSRGYSPYAVARTMTEAVVLGRSFAAPGDIVMLNPGFASFGLFRDFQERGEAFKHAVIED